MFLPRSIPHRQQKPKDFLNGLMSSWELCPQPRFKIAQLASKADVFNSLFLSFYLVIINVVKFLRDISIYNSIF